MKIFTCIVGLLFTILLQAQRNAPVAGDAAALTDLLHKDYSILSYDQVFRIMEKDRKAVISLLKKYQGDMPQAPSYLDEISTKLKDIGDKRDTLFALQTSIDSDKERALKKAGVVLDVTEISTSEKNIRKARQEIFKIQYEIDKLQFHNLRENYNNNSYLKYMVTQFEEKYSSSFDTQIDGYAMARSQSTINKSLPLLGGDLALETVVDGLSKFIAKRVKQELQVYAVQKISEYLNVCKDTDSSKCLEKEMLITELKIIIPTTFNYINDIEDFNINNLGSDLKEYLEKDLDMLLVNIPKLRTSERFKDKLGIQLALKGTELITELNQTKNPVEFIDVLTLDKELAALFTENEIIALNNYLNTASLLAYALTITENGERNFITLDFVSKYGTNLNYLLLFYGFLHQQATKEYFFDTFPTKQLMQEYPIDNMNTLKKDLSKLHLKISEVIKVSNRIYSNARKIKISSLDPESEISPETAHIYIEDVISFTKGVTELGKPLFKMADNKDIHRISTKMNYYFEGASYINDIVLDVRKKRYNNALFGAVTSGLAMHNIVQDTITNATVKPSEINSRITQVINFYANVAQATDAEGVEKAIESFALPQGSYKNKRVSSSYIGIDSYPGILLGYDSTNNDAINGAFTTGITAPIGISMKFWEGKTSLFVSLIDIAAPFRLRLDDQNATKTISDYTIQNILAPGLYFNIPINESPFAFNVGAQYGPQLDFNENEMGGIENDLNDTFRIGVGFVIDIPLFNIYRN